MKFGSTFSLFASTGKGEEKDLSYLENSAFAKGPNPSLAKGQNPALLK